MFLCIILQNVRALKKKKKKSRYVKSKKTGNIVVKIYIMYFKSRVKLYYLLDISIIINYIIYVYYRKTLYIVLSQFFLKKKSSSKIRLISLSQ